jgi:hypothetical protein
VEFGLDGGQFCARFVVDMVHSVGAAIPIAAVAKVALDLVQHRVNPRGGGVVFVLLDQFMRNIPLAGQSQFHRLEQIIVQRAHGGCFTAEPARQQGGVSRPNTGRLPLKKSQERVCALAARM